MKKKLSGIIILYMKYFLAFTVLFFSACMSFSLDTENNIVEKAKEYIGTPYEYGGTSPSGFDCSGFVYFLYKDHVKGISSVASMQAKLGEAVARKDLLPGDLTFWATGSNPKSVTHVGIYIGNNQMIGALSEGPRLGIQISDMDSSYWKGRFLFARRVLDGKTFQADSGENTVPDADEPVNDENYYTKDQQAFEDFLDAEKGKY